MAVNRLARALGYFRNVIKKRALPLTATGRCALTLFLMDDNKLAERRPISSRERRTAGEGGRRGILVDAARRRGSSELTNSSPIHPSSLPLSPRSPRLPPSRGLQTSSSPPPPEYRLPHGQRETSIRRRRRQSPTFENQSSMLPPPPRAYTAYIGCRRLAPFDAAEVERTD